MSRVLYEFNTKNNSQSWNINAYRITSISGDDLILHPSSNSNIKIEGNIIPSISEKYNLGDSNNKIRYIYVNQINGDVSGNLYGNASTSTKLERIIKIGGVDFTGEDNINLPGVNIIGNQDTTGNAATTTKLKSDIYIGGVPFDGTKSINLPGVNEVGTMGTLGISSQAMGLYYKPLICGIQFDGKHDINLPGVDIDGTQNTSGKAGSVGSLINDNSYANITLKDNDINYVGLNHNFDGSLNNTQITNLTNDIVLIKEKLNAILTRQGLPTF